MAGLLFFSSHFGLSPSSNFIVLSKFKWFLWHLYGIVNRGILNLYCSTQTKAQCVKLFILMIENTYWTSWVLTVRQVLVLQWKLFAMDLGNERYQESTLNWCKTGGKKPETKLVALVPVARMLSGPTVWLLRLFVDQVGLVYARCL